MNPTTEPQLTTVHLVGSLGRRFGETWQLDVRSPGEAIRAIVANTRGAFEDYLRGPGARRYYQIALGERDQVIPFEEGTHRSGTLDIWFIPTIKGRDSAWGKIGVGLAFLALAFFTAGTAFAAYAPLSSLGSGVTVGGLLTTYGIALVLGGMAQAFTPSARGDQGQSAADPNPSKTFQGNAVAVVQGECVPVIYGRALVPAFPISISVDNNVTSVTAAGELGDVGQTDLPGGGVQYN